MIRVIYSVINIKGHPGDSPQFQLFNYFDFIKRSKEYYLHGTNYMFIYIPALL